MKQTRWHNGKESRLVAYAEGWVMVRRHGASPYTMLAKEWEELPSVELGRECYEKYSEAGRNALKSEGEI